MFNNSKYTTWYYNIIESAKQYPEDGYTEKHHIIPKSMGGSNDTSNLISLSARQHYIVHLLLTKMTSGKNRQKMFYAMNMIINSPSGDDIKTSRLYEYVRKNHAEAVSKSKKGTITGFANTAGKTHEEIFGKEKSAKIKKSIAKSNSSRVWSNESKKRVSESQKRRAKERPESFVTGPKSEKHKKALSESIRKKHRQNDTIIRTWIHKTHGTFIGTNSELADKMEFQVHNINRITNPKYVHEHSYRGWRLLP